MKKRVLQICLSEGFGGLEMYVPKISENLRKNGYDVLTIFKKDTFLDKNSKDYDIKEKSISSKGYLDIFAYFKLLKIVKKFNPEIIHAHQSKDLFFASFLTKNLKNVKLFFTDHMGNTYNKKDLLHRFLYKEVYKVISITDEVKRRDIKYLPVEKNKIERVYYGIELEKFNPKNFNSFNDYDEKYKVLKNDIKIGLTARICKDKGQDIFLKAALILLKKYKNLKFFIIGDGDKEVKKDLLNFVKNNSIEKNVVFTNFTKEIPKHMAYMDFTVVPSKNEAFGLTVIESMAMKKAVIGSNKGGIPELIKDNKDGFLFDYENIDSLVTKIEFFINNKEKIEEFGKRAREKVEKEFDYQIHLKNIEKLYNE